MAFGAFLVCEVALVVLVASGRSSLTPVKRFDASIAGPFARLGAHVVHGQMAHRAAFVGLMAALCVCYAVLALQAPRMPARLSVAAVAVACVVIVLGPPLRLTDVFNYVDFARLSVLHELNPYVHAPVDALRDPAFKFTAWHHQPTPYGPLFTLLT
ncbi:MAG: hypothetical protein M3155_00005, partial [Actinomycetota bacterium]|nr:hypothetical protein [Actinomycetota bacterium]